MDAPQPSNLLLKPKDDIVERAKSSVQGIPPPGVTDTVQSVLGDVPDDNLVHFVVVVSAPRSE